MSGLEGLLAGRTLSERYRIEEVIGRGGFAAVYRAEDERLGRTVALKVITLGSADPAVRDSIRRRFAREGRVAASLHHVNVATVFDVGTDPELDLDYLVMELLHGEDLAARLARAEPLPPREAVRLLRDAARGLAAGHRRGLIHRDVKPANVFLAEQERTDRFRVCILDFGIAQIRSAEHSLTRLTRGGAPLSPPYASPEQLREERDVTPAADVWGLGVIAYQLFAGERPYGPDEIQAMIRGDAPPPPRFDGLALPDGVETVIRRALAPEPEARFADAGEMTDALDAVHDALRGELRPAAAVPAPPAVPPVDAATQIDAVPSVDVKPSVDAVPPVDVKPSVDAATPVDVEPPVEAVPPPPVHPKPQGPGAVPQAATPRRRGSRLPRIAVPLVLLLLAALGGWWALAGRSGSEPRVAVRAPSGPAATADGAGTDQAPTTYSGGPLPAGTGTSSGSASTGGAPDPTISGPIGGASAVPATGTPSAPTGAAPVSATPAPDRASPAPGIATAPPRASAPPAAPPAASPGPAAAPARTAPRVATPAPSTPRPSSTGSAAELNRRAERLFDRGDYAGAAAGFRRAVAAAPTNAYYRNNLGWALFLAGDLDGADRELRETVRLDPGRAIAYANLGEVRWKSGDTEGAVANYRRFLELNTDPRRERIATEKLQRMGATP